VKAAQRPVVARKRPFALQHVHLDARLVVRRGREHLALARRNRRVARNQRRHHAAHRLDAERERGDVEQQEILHVAGENARLHGRAEVDAQVASEAAAHLWGYFPGLEGRALTHAWGGPIDASPTHLPLVLPLSGDRAFCAAGYTGNGVGPSHMLGRTLASLALDRRDDPSRLAFVDPKPQRVPPEPFHWLGGEAIRAGIVRKEKAELAGRAPDPISSLLARIPQLIGFHIGR